MIPGMEVWHVDSPNVIGNLRLSSAALLLKSARTPDPRSWLDFMGDIAPIDYLCVVEYVQRPVESGSATPELVGGASTPDVSNVTHECFSLYRKAYWRIDDATPFAQRGGDAGNEILGMRLRREDIKDDSWRQEIYDKTSLEERLTLLYSPVPGTSYAMNLYRSARNGSFSDLEIHSLMEVAPLVRLAHQAAIAERGSTERAIDERIHDAARRLGQRVPALSSREQEVSARIACGVSADGIAADLGISVSTVATLRKRAYRKIADAGYIPNRSQLTKLIS